MGDFQCKIPSHKKKADLMKTGVLCLAVITILFAAYQTLFIIAISLSPPGSDPLFNITLFPGVLVLSALWVYVTLMRIIRNRKKGRGKTR